MFNTSLIMIMNIIIGFLVIYNIFMIYKIIKFRRDLKEANNYLEDRYVFRKSVYKKIFKALTNHYFYYLDACKNSLYHGAIIDDISFYLSCLSINKEVFIKVIKSLDNDESLIQFFTEYSKLYSKEVICIDYFLNKKEIEIESKCEFLSLLIKAIEKKL